MRDIHHHLHLHQQHQQQQEQQQKLINEARPSIFSHNQHYNYQQPQQIFQQLQNLPTPQEFFHYQTHFQAFLQQQQYYQEQQRRLQDQHSAVSQDNFHNIAGIPVNFTPDLNKDSGKGGVLNEEDGGLFRGSEQYVPETRSTALAVSHCWQNQEDSAIRQPFWRNKRGIEVKDKEEEPEMNQNKDYGYDEETEGDSSLRAGTKSRLFGELEAICGHSAAIGKSNQTGSGSSLNNDESLARSTCLLPANANPLAFAAARFGHDHGSETSAGNEEEPSSRVQKKIKKKKKVKDEMASMAHFFERLVNQLIDHQEVLYKKFLDMIERIDKERKEREETWRRQELEKLQLEVAAKAHDRALASNREASIVAYLEKITGQSIELSPRREPTLESQPEISVANANELSPPSSKTRNLDSLMSKRWPKPEVESLIQIRSRLESRFQEPALKGPIWEEISKSMSSMGYQRSAKRCKEKWENINKYFKKFKENPKERRQKLKSCEYFDQLNQLYSKSTTSGCHGCSSSTVAQETLNIRQVEFKNPFVDFESCSFEKFEQLQTDTDQVEGKEEDDNGGELGEELE